jgi:ketosteroid isomerase-like protein
VARDAGDAVVSCHHVRAQGTSGVELEFDYGYVWKLREGKILYCKAFRDPSDALEAAGLRE